MVKEIGINLKDIKKSTYNTYDIIPISIDEIEKNMKALDADKAPEVTEPDIFTDIKRIINTIKETEKEYARIECQKSGEYIDKLIEIYHAEREKVFKTNLRVPVHALTKFYGTKDIITKATLTPRTRLKNLKEIAEKLGFMILPWEYHNKGSYENESYKLIDSIHEFEKLERYADLYVLTPINYWDIESHIKAEDPNKYIYAPTRLKDVVRSVEIQLPVLRQFHNRIKSLENENEKITQTVEEMQHVLDKIVRDIADLRKEQLKMKNRMSVIEAELEETKSMVLQAIDPLLFAVPKGHNMGEDCDCIIGPAWGPDFSWHVLVSENLVPIPNQRKLIERINPFLLNYY